MCNALTHPGKRRTQGLRAQRREATERTQPAVEAAGQNHAVVSASWPPRFESHLPLHFFKHLARVGPSCHTSFTSTKAINFRHNHTMSGQTRSQIQPGMKVRVVEKENQRTGKLTEGIVNRILTKSPHHPHGIKVLLETGVVGRVKEIVTNSPP
jgi:uncharacterized repeat protein (TIGR03833 family)